MVSASTLLTSRILYELYTLENTLGVVYARTTNGSTGITGPQQTTDSSLIILYLICSYYCDFMSFLGLVL